MADLSPGPASWTSRPPPRRQLMQQLEGTTAQFGPTHQRDYLTTFGKYAAVLVSYRLPHRVGNLPSTARKPTSTAQSAPGFDHEQLAVFV